jgi:hypothetical protein
MKALGGLVLRFLVANTANIAGFNPASWGGQRL